MAKRVRSKTQRARRLRRDATDVERLLWYALRSRLVAWKFRRQHPIGHRIVDFACVRAKLVIELDGGQHALQEEAEQRRSDELAQRGYHVLRFWNNDVLDDLDGVLESIRRVLDDASPHPNSPPLRGGEERHARSRRH